MRKKEIAMPESWWVALEERQGRTAIRVPDQIRLAVKHHLDGPEPANAGKSILPLLGKAPCGPLRQALNDTRHVDIGDAAEILKVEPDDFLIEADGTSMASDDVSKHIPSGAWLLMRPGLMADGEVALVRMKRANGEYHYTIKKWVDGRLRDGKGKEVPIPADVEEAIPVAVKRGLIGPWGAIRQ